MTKQTFIKVFSAAALVILLTPVAASAHGLGFGGGVFGGWNKEDVRSNNQDKKDKTDKWEKKWEEKLDSQKNASTSADVIAKASARTADIADFMASMSATIGAKIAGSDLSASAKADANANLSDYNGDVAGAKTQANAAAAAAAKVDADNSTATNASFITEARADLSAAWDFLKSAKEELHNILSSLWGSK
jgi:hypothetical protein